MCDHTKKQTVHCKECAVILAKYAKKIYKIKFDGGESFCGSALLKAANERSAEKQLALVHGIEKSKIIETKICIDPDGILEFHSGL